MPVNGGITHCTGLSKQREAFIGESLEPRPS